MINRQEQIRKKGFQMSPMRDTREKYSPSMDPNFSKIKVGLKTLDDAIVNVGDYKQIDDRLADKKEVLRAIHENDEETMRDISEFFYKTSGIYSRLCRYMANLYRYDWLVTPYINSDSVKSDKILSGFNNVLTYLDNFEIKKFFGDTALKVLKYGCYYGYLIPQKDRTCIQELPPNYCRSRFSVNGRPAVEFNMKFFDDTFRDTTQKMKALFSLITGKY